MFPHLKEFPMFGLSLTLLHVSEGKGHGLESGLVRGGLLEDGVQYGAGLQLPSAPDQSQAFQHFARQKVGLFLQNLVGFVQGLLVVATVDTV